MPDLELAQPAQQWVNVVLIWLGFGILAGLLARALAPGRHPVGAVATLVIGLVGSAAGLWVVSLLLGNHPFNPISPIGLMASTAGAFVILVAYRVLAACIEAGAEVPDSQNLRDGP